MTVNPRLKEAHKHSSRHRVELDESDLVGCFHCKETYSLTAVKEYVDENDTALCPVCGIDSVIGSASGFPLSAEFLEEMHQLWFVN
jgi:hypothetical protein